MQQILRTILLLSILSMIGCNAEDVDTFPTAKNIQTLKGKCIASVKNSKAVHQSLFVHVDSIHEKGGTCTATWFEIKKDEKIKIESTFEVSVTTWE